MIRMKTNKEEYCSCNSCRVKNKDALQMFDVQIGSMTVTLCDECNAKLLGKTIKAANMVNEMLKTPALMRIIRRREKRDKEL